MHRVLETVHDNRCKGKAPGHVTIQTECLCDNVIIIIESVDSISRDRWSGFAILYVIHYKYPKLISQNWQFCEISKCENQNLQQIIYLTRPRSSITCQNQMFKKMAICQSFFLVSKASSRLP